MPASLSATPNEPQTPCVCVVIIGRNEGQRLARCITSVQAIQDVDDAIEVIYADSGSTDGSVQLAAETGARTIATRRHPLPRWAATPAGAQRTRISSSFSTATPSCTPASSVRRWRPSPPTRP